MAAERSRSRSKADGDDEKKAGGDAKEPAEKAAENGASKSRSRSKKAGGSSPRRRRRSRSRRKSGSRSRSRSRGKSEENLSPEERLARLRQELEDFTKKHDLDDRAHRIMANMHPFDVRAVMKHPFPTDCRNPTGFVVSVIRKVETEACRAQGYKWDGVDWSEPKKRDPAEAAADRAKRKRMGGSRDRRGRGGGRSRDSRSRSKRRRSRSRRDDRRRGGRGERRRRGGGGRRGSARDSRRKRSRRGGGRRDRRKAGRDGGGGRRRGREKERRGRRGRSPTPSESAYYSEEMYSDDELDYSEYS
eukprot:TRINITY_DN47384_c0_g1_i1.p1 TRINITY_DN47384_c0_g1~~TRINITY_DN47384_c0_g1_i1.p1  ORF type:complete len:303 (-),score=57.06 TRINITY_DN47384_c0_g1_i1:87-995(-)